MLYVFNEYSAQSFRFLCFLHDNNIIIKCCQMVNYTIILYSFFCNIF